MTTTICEFQERLMQADNYDESVSIFQKALDQLGIAGFILGHTPYDAEFLTGLDQVAIDSSYDRIFLEAYDELFEEDRISEYCFTETESTVFFHEELQSNTAIESQKELEGFFIGRRLYSCFVRPQRINGSGAVVLHLGERSRKSSERYYRENSLLLEGLCDSFSTHLHASSAFSGLFKLTNKELEVFKWLAGGLSPVQISMKLNVSVGTVNNHISSIYRKTKSKSRYEATYKGTEYGLFE